MSCPFISCQFSKTEVYRGIHDFLIFALKQIVGTH